MRLAPETVQSWILALALLSSAASPLPLFARETLSGLDSIISREYESTLAGAAASERCQLTDPESANRQESLRLLNIFCADPYEALCKRVPPTSILLASDAESFPGYIGRQREILREHLKRHRLDRGVYSIDSEILFAASGRGRLNEPQRNEYLRAIHQSFERELAQIGFEEHLRELRESFRQTVLSADGFSKSHRGRLLELLSEARLIRSDELGSQHLSFEDYTLNCDSLGVERNAVAMFREGTFILCPALMNAALQMATADSGRKLNALSFVILHEMAHTLDESAVEPSALARVRRKMHRNPFRSCLKDVFGFSDERVKTYYREIYADQWAIEAWTENRVRRAQEENLSRMEILAQLQASVSLFCQDSSGQDETQASHLSARPRVNLIGRNAKLRAMMGCAPPTRIKPACDWSGKLQ